MRVPLHRGFEGLGEKGWQFFRLDQELDASGDARLSPDQSGALQGEHHLMNRWWADAEMALLGGEVWFWDRGIHVT
jgi:hypothetical protein